MALETIKPFSDAFQHLSECRFAREIKEFQWSARKKTLLKSLLVAVPLVAAVAAIALLGPSNLFLGMTIGVLILAAFLIDHHRRQDRRMTTLFQTAQGAVQNISSNTRISSSRLK